MKLAPRDAAREALRRAQKATDVDDPQRVSRAKAEYDAALKNANDASGLPAPTGVEPPRCLEHDWPAPEERGKPMPPKSECPECKARSERSDRRPYAPETLEIEQPGPQPTSLMQRAWEEHQEKLEDEGAVLPGGALEDAALEHIDAARPDDGSVIAGSRYENGEWVTWRHPPKKPRSIRPWPDRLEAVRRADREIERMRLLSERA